MLPRYYSDNDEDGLDMRKALPRDVHKVCTPATACVVYCVARLLPHQRVPLKSWCAGQRGTVQEDVHLGGLAGGERILDRVAAAALVKSDRVAAAARANYFLLLGCCSARKI